MLKLAYCEHSNVTERRDRTPLPAAVVCRGTTCLLCPFRSSKPTRQVQCLMLRANCSLLVYVGNPNPAGSFALATALSPTIQCPSFSRSPHSMWRARSAKRHRPISRTYAEQNADKLKAIATFEK